MRLYKYAKELTDEELRKKIDALAEYINEGRKGEGKLSIDFGEWPATREGLEKLLDKLEEMK